MKKEFKRNSKSRRSPRTKESPVYENSEYDYNLIYEKAVAHGLSNARKIMELIKAGKAEYHFIEVMCCPGGCIGGGGKSFTCVAESVWKMGVPTLAG